MQTDFNNYNHRVFDIDVRGVTMLSEHWMGLSLAISQHQLGFLPTGFEETERCAVCNKFFLEPALFTGCGCSKHHIIACSACDSPCKICSKPFTQRVPLMLYDRVIESKMVKCKSCNTECKIGKKLSGLIDHVTSLDSVCQVECKLCQAFVTIPEFHQHYASCALKQLSCPLAEYLKTLPPESERDVPEKCSFVGTRDELKVHILEKKHDVALDMFNAGLKFRPISSRELSVAHGVIHNANTHVMAVEEEEEEEDSSEEEERDHGKRKRTKKLTEVDVMLAVNKWARDHYKSTRPNAIVGLTSVEAADLFTEETGIELYRKRGETSGERKLLTGGLNGIPLAGDIAGPAPYGTKFGKVFLREKAVSLIQLECNLCPYIMKTTRLICDGCNKDFHLVCAGFNKKPSAKHWYCNSCQE